MLKNHEMCGSRKYPYLPRGRFFVIKVHTFAYKFWLLRPPSPLEFPVTFHGVGMDISWNHNYINSLFVKFLNHIELDNFPLGKMFMIEHFCF